MAARTVTPYHLLLWFFSCNTIAINASPTFVGDASNEKTTINEEMSTVGIDFSSTESHMIVDEEHEARPAGLAGSRPAHPCQRPCLKGAPTQTCHYNFSVEWYYAMSKACHYCINDTTDCYREDCIPADGVKRPVVVVNKLLPGPSIEVCLGDHIVVDVANHLMDESTSIHWHGHHQRDSPYMDGVPFVSQCPISPNSVFRYQFTAAHPGTHFWHSHTGVQRGDGSFGSLIIRTPDYINPLASLYEEDLYEHTMIIHDWSHELSMAIFTAHYHSDGDNKPQSILVNGHGRFYQDSEQLTSTPLQVFTVKKGLRYRFRLINAGVQNCPIDLTIDNHTMTVISSDGADVTPTTVGSLVSYAGERWDFVLEANADTDNYWMRFTGLMDCDERFTKAHQVAVLHYQDAVEQDALAKVGYNVHEKRNLQLNSLNVAVPEEGTISITNLKNLDKKKDLTLKEIPDKQIYLSFDFNPKNNPHYHKTTLYGFSEVRNENQVYTPQFNDISMKFPHFPLLSQYYNIKNDTFCDHELLKNCSSIFCECTNVVNVPLGNVLEIILIDKGETYDANHPFHLHGHSFRVIGMDRLGKSLDMDTVKTLDKANKLIRNLEDPPIKDTVTVPDGGYTILRVHATNPGYWLFHCHIEFHVEVGMALIFKVGEHSDFPPVPQGFPKCGDYFSSPEELLNNENRTNLQKTLSEFTYNATTASERDKGFFKLLSDWWKNNTYTASAATRYSNSLLTCISVITLSLYLKYWYPDFILT